MMSMQAICEDCEKQFQVDSTTVVEQWYRVMDDGERIKLTSYDCPFCGRTHYVQVDNDKTIDKLERCTRLMAKATRQKTNKGRADGSVVTMLKRSRAKLHSMRMDLMDKYNDSLVVNEDTEEAFNVRFSL